MGLAYKFYDTVIGELVNKTRLYNKRVAKSNRESKDKYMYMTKDDGEKIRDFIDLDNKRQEQILEDAQVLKKAYLSDEVVEKITEEIDKIFEKEYYSYTNRLHEHKTVLESYRAYLDGIEDRIRDYEKMALKSNTKLEDFGVTCDRYNEEIEGFRNIIDKYNDEINHYNDIANKYGDEIIHYNEVANKYIDEIESYNDILNKYENKLNAFQTQSIADKELMANVQCMVEKNMELDLRITNNVHNELAKYNAKIQDYLEDEFTKIAARNIKSKKKLDAMTAFLVTSNLITIAGLIAIYILK